MKLSEKQRVFLDYIASSPRYMPDQLPLICIDRMPEDIWFTFRTENQAFAWVKNLATRGFVTIENDCFARITEKGILAVKTK